eukprot:XP_003725052.1 PREDICTED: uncharacterized protein LOC100888496 [Strongylocentrotus purpuratus]
MSTDETTMGDHDDVTALKQSCRAYSGTLTKKYKELEVLMLDPDNSDVVANKYEQLNSTFDSYTERFNQLREKLTADDADAAVKDFNARQSNKQEFDQRMVEWTRDADVINNDADQGRRDVDDDDDDDDDNDDDVKADDVGNDNDERASLTSAKSFRSRTSQRSSASSTSTARLREAKLKAELVKNKHEQMKRTNELQLAKIKLEQEIAGVQVEHELKGAELELRLLEDEIENSSMYSVGRSSAPSVAPRVAPSVNENANIGLNPKASAWPGNEVDLPKSNVNVDTKINEVFHAVDLALNMPKPELGTFSGNPLEYWTFINRFEATVGSRAINEKTKLMYLIQFCAGKARDSIDNCVLLQEGEGYSTAKQILAEQFGQSFCVTTAHMHKVLNRQPLRPNDGAAMWDLARDMRRCEMVLSQMGFSADMDSTDNLLRIQQLLPIHLQSEWAKRAHRMMKQGIAPNFRMMVDFVEEAAQLGTNMFGQNIGKQKAPPPPKGKPSGSYRTTLNTQGKGSDMSEEKCPCCSKLHDLQSCHSFKQKPREERMKVVRQARLCDNCFKPHHLARGCGQGSNCNVNGCKWKHHTLLHLHLQSQRQEEVTPQREDPVEQPNEPTAIGNNYTTTTTHKVCLRVVPVRIRSQMKDIQTWALLDEGSDISLCEASLIKELGITGSEKEFELTTVNGPNIKRKGLEVSLTVENLNGKEEIDLSRVWSVESLPISSTSIPDGRDIKKWDHLQGIEFPTINQREVKLLIGGDTPEAFWVMEQRRGKRKEPYAIRSPLGWTLMGPTRRGSDNHPGFNVHFTRTEQEALHQQLERFWELDHAVGNDLDGAADSVEDRRARNIMDESTILKNGHYEVGLPWKHIPPCLPRNRHLAEVRLKYLKNKFKKDEECFNKYKGTIEGYIEKGFAEEITPTTPESSDDHQDAVWYLPHHPVTHPHKPDKLRVVFDCAARYKGTSLNDQLLRGPDYTNNLVGVLTRFRQEPVAIVGDIEGMFHQVKVPTKDRDALRFLWWKDGDLSKDPIDYRMTVHLFGATSSPSCASYALRKTANDNKDTLPENVIKTVQENFYVDDCLKSVPTTKEAVELVGDLCDLLQKGGFRLTKWMSNELEVLSSIPEPERAKSIVNLDLDDLPIERTLGVLWNVSSDSFEFQVNIKEKPTTRRGILSAVSSLYDPLGFLAPFILRAKLLLQSLCRRGLDWDEKVDEGDVRTWKEWLDDLPRLTGITIPRCLKPDAFKDIASYELHHFCDASEQGYAAVTYLRLVNTDGKIHCAFVMGKSRLCPLKVTSIPRLELTAAVLAVDVDRMVRNELWLPYTRTVYWTDSTAVLHYIRNESRRFQTYIANRVAKIQEASEPSQWRHVDTKSNPADDGSRGLLADEMKENPRWLEGPQFLWADEGSWPSPPAVIPDLPYEDPEIRKSARVNLTMYSDKLADLLNRYSSWTKLKRCVAWLLRYKAYLRAKVKGDNISIMKRPTLTLEELHVAESSIIKTVQRQAFGHALNLRTKGKTLEKLNATVIDGILRVGGRINNAPVEFDVKHPIILPSQHHVTKLLILHHHLNVGHSGAGMTWASLRERYWVLKGGATVRQVIGKCWACRRRNAPRAQQMMADLPDVRVTPDRPPFTYVGVDYFGPFHVKQGRSRVKRYGCIFTCLTMRAVHIEIANSLDTDSFINALRRFISRRGKPEKIHSDNGSNFRGAERELRESLETLDQDKVDRFLQETGVRWSFNPPTASHMGGAWERMIRSIRKLLRSIIGEQLVGDEVLATVMAEVEWILNSRPLTQLSLDARDGVPLTPNHLLLLKQSPNLPPGVFEKADTYGRRRWRQAQYLSSLFWKRWRREYLPLLQERQKWTKPQRNIAKDDLVLVVDDNAPRGQWPLGKIVDVFPGRDHRVRQVEVRIGTKYFRRPITKLCLLDPAVGK